MKRYLIALCTTLALTAALLTTMAVPAQAASLSPGYPYTIGGQVTAVYAYNNCGLYSTYLLDTKGGMYVAGNGQSYGSAAGQGYFAGRTAYAMEVYFTYDKCHVAGYKIFSTDNSQYNYGDTSGHFGSSGFISRYTQNTAPFWLNGPVCFVGAYYGKYWIVQCNGAIFTTAGAPFYGSAAGQSYFNGRTAALLVVCNVGGGGLTGYAISTTSNELYRYGNTANNCVSATFNNN